MDGEGKIRHNKVQHWSLTEKDKLAAEEGLKLNEALWGWFEFLESERIEKGEKRDEWEQAWFEYQNKEEKKWKNK